MKCDFCQLDVPALIHLRVYTPQGIEACGECYETIDSQRHKPYSKVMDKLAMIEAGYHVNRKVATLYRATMPRKEVNTYGSEMEYPAGD